MRKILILTLVMSSLVITIAGCQEAVKWPKPGKVSVFIEGGGKFPENLAGNWKGSREGWGFVFEKDGSISKARIDTGRQIVIPGKVNIGKTRHGGRKGILKGTLVFDGIKEQGDYQVRMFFKDSYDAEAVYNFSVAKPSETSNESYESGKPFIKTNKSSYLVGEEIEVEFKNAFGVPRDWIGIYQKDAPQDKVLKWCYTDGRQRGESRYIPGDWSVTYIPESHELAVEIEMRDIYVEMAGAVVHGKSSNYFVGTVSEDGTKWKATQFGYPDFDNFPIDPVFLPNEYQIVFTKVDGDI